MKWLVFSLALFAAARCMAQPPPNDLFENRIRLAGSSVTFIATNQGASYGEDGCEPCAGGPWCSGSVWWSWTATESSPVIIEQIAESGATLGGLSIFSGTNFCAMNNQRICDIDLTHRGRYAIFEAQAGTEYQILVAGNVLTPITFRLRATNAPSFRLHPKSQTLFPGQSALFTSSAIGIAPLSFQWQKNGTNIPGATNRCLAIYNVGSGEAGDYSMVATSPMGSSTSRVAQLVVRNEDVNPSLQAEGIFADTNLEFVVTGEMGRVYRCEQSADLTNWSGPIIFVTNETSRFSVAKDAPQKFVRLSAYHPANEICNCNLKQIWYALWQCSEDRHASPWVSLIMSDIAPYCMNGKIPNCPLFDASEPYYSYCIVDASTRPNCVSSPWSHILEEMYVGSPLIDF